MAAKSVAFSLWAMIACVTSQLPECISIRLQGRSQDFQGGGGNLHITSTKSLLVAVQGPLKGPGSFRILAGNNFPGIASQFAMHFCMTAIQNIFCEAVFFHRSVQNLI